MNILKKYWTIIPLFLFGYLFIRNFIISYEEEFIFDFEILFFIGVLFIVFFIITIYRGIKNFRIANRPIELLPMLLGLIFVFVFLGILYKNERIDSSPIVLRANYDGDINGFSLEFRKDGTYKFFNYSFFGGKYYRGNYTLRDSILILDKNNIDNVISTNKLVIRNFNDNDFKKTCRRVSSILELSNNDIYKEKIIIVMAVSRLKCNSVV